MPDSPELAGQKLLDMLPDGCELRTSVTDIGDGWKATAQVINPHDTPKPVYVGRGPTGEAALLRAIEACASYWDSRLNNQGHNGR